MDADALTRDRRALLGALQRNGGALQLMSPHLCADREVVLTAVTQHGDALKYASMELRADREVVLQAVATTPEALQFSCLMDMKDSKAAALLAVSQDGHALEFAAATLLSDIDVVYAAVSKEGAALEFAAPELRNHFQVVLAAVSNDGLALEFASSELRLNRDIVLAALAQDGLALEFASEQLRRTSDVVLAALAKSSFALKFAVTDEEVVWNSVMGITSQHFILKVRLVSGRSCLSMWPPKGDHTKANVVEDALNAFDLEPSWRKSVELFYGVQVMQVEEYRRGLKRPREATATQMQAGATAADSISEENVSPAQMAAIDGLISDATRQGNIIEAFREQLMLKAVIENRFFALKKQFDDIGNLVGRPTASTSLPAHMVIGATNTRQSAPSMIVASSSAPRHVQRAEADREQMAILPSTTMLSQSQADREQMAILPSTTMLSQSQVPVVDLMAGQTTFLLATDGACSGNPGPGGWGYVMQFGGEERQESGFLRDTTNNAMELTATIRGLQMCQQLGRGCTVEVLMDSKYVIEGATKWIKTWKRNNWLTVKRTPVLNRELWVQLDALMGPHVRLEWVKGHGSCDLHNRADALARAAVQAPSS